MPDLVASFACYLAQVRMLSPAVVKRYARAVDQFAGYLADTAGGLVALDAVGKDQLEQFLRRGANGEPSRAVWNNRLAALRAFYEYLFKQELIALNPAKRVERLRIHSRERQPLSFDEVLALVDAVDAASGARYRARNIAIVKVFFHCALRVAEVVSLNLDQVDLANYVFRDVRTKGDKRLSAVFNDVVAEALERYLKARDGLGRPGDDPALFLSDRGRRLSIRAVQGLLKRYGAKAGIGRTVTPHLLRHSNVTELVELGTALPVVQEICGHASVTTTERYVHVNGSLRRQAIDQLGERWTREVRARRRKEKEVMSKEQRAALPRRLLNFA